MIGNKPSKKKIAFSVSENLINYLGEYNRLTELPIKYDDLLRYNNNLPLITIDGKNTLWETVFYPELEYQELNEALCTVYAKLTADGDEAALEHLKVARIDFCTFGNTKPFRIRIINKLNDNYDHFYVKQIDASRIYGLELERLLSPNWLSYLTDGTTLIEHHVAGIPGDDFIADSLDAGLFNKTRIAKEFIKFNERCFVRLLGDMRAYNYVVDITPDIEGNQYRIRAIDFDQQSYEGRKSFYLPQYFKENNPIIEMGMEIIAPNAVKQYQLEERSLIGFRAKNAKNRINKLLKAMTGDELSTPEKVKKLTEELAYHHKNDSFLNCKNMGEIVLNNIKLVLSKEFKQSYIDLGLN